MPLPRRLPGEDFAKEIVQKASPFAKGMALVVGVLFLSLGMLLYFNKEYFADIRDYKVTIAELRSEMKFSEKERSALTEVITLLRTQVASQAAELDSLRSELAQLKAQVKNP